MSSATTLYLFTPLGDVLLELRSSQQQQQDGQPVVLDSLQLGRIVATVLQQRSRFCELTLTTNNDAASSSSVARILALRCKHGIAVAATTSSSVVSSSWLAVIGLAEWWSLPGNESIAAKAVEISDEEHKEEHFGTQQVMAERAAATTSVADDQFEQTALAHTLLKRIMAEKEPADFAVFLRGAVSAVSNWRQYESNSIVGIAQIKSDRWLLAPDLSSIQGLPSDVAAVSSLLLQRCCCVACEISFGTKLKALTRCARIDNDCELCVVTLNGGS